jgi:hypothetical protein
MTEIPTERRRFLAAAITFFGVAGNPTLTIVALAIRQAKHIAERMLRKTL